jgi:pimeloyl-ACP methyl ester carboxylesterase/lysophospholipase L1-like esterase
MIEFSFQDHAAKVVFPKEANGDKHWIWRARFWGHEPQTDIALLDLGFHLVYVDVADLFGCPEAVDIWNDFYQFLLEEYDLNRKTVLEGFSRGGLIIYNWAAENTDKVACIYADAPVCDFKSWPGGKGIGKGSEASWQKCLDAYGLDESSAMQYRGIPIFTAEKVADAKIPVLHVCGNADEVVPIAENTYVIQQIFHDRDTPFKLIEKEGVGHHPHSLKNPTPIIRFILEHTAPDLITDQMNKVADRTVFFRSSLGNAFYAFEKTRQATVAFLGGSITFNGGWRDSTMNYLRHHFPETEFNFVNAGIPSMGSVPGAFRLEADVLSEGPIDLLFVEAAVNDETNGRSAQAQLRGMEGIVRHALSSNPKMDIVMMHFADPDKIAAYNRDESPQVIQQHEKVANHYQITSINLAKEVNDRILNGEFSWKDDFKDLHPSPFGQELYANTIKWTFDSLYKIYREGTQSVRVVPTRPLDVYSYSDGHFMNIKKAKKRKDWKIIKGWQPRDQKPTRTGFVNVPALEAIGPGARLSLDFEGKAIGILVAAGPDAGVLEYSVDGHFYKKIDLFTRWSSQLHLPWLYILEDELREGSHHLVLRMAEHKNENSKGYACRIFQFAVN